MKSVRKIVYINSAYDTLTNEWETALNINRYTIDEVKSFSRHFFSIIFIRLKTGDECR